MELTVESKDYLTALPAELLYSIFDYLVPSHQPDNAFHPGIPKPQPLHELGKLLYVSQSLHSHVNSWAEHFHRAHQSTMRLRLTKTINARQKRFYFHKVQKWASRHCIFCGKTSRRSAILASSLKCCAKCDKQRWPEKITKTDAKAEFDLRNHQLQPHLHPRFAHINGLPRVRYGTYFTSNIATTMFVRSDVKRLAEFIHGDLVTHKQRKKAEAVERERRRAERGMRR
ncbi:hypothetical protein BAUCODRAFT_79033 [Baudoinia panamericana UAMH 10762]|uniref:F-box domain-containing protein n=1 Tax=Baudoinia panamericana (strain UAMH 10762) TaxID=717646 RepID=M2MZA6_BAUPA|nr:uncharacterized protein BAUCODRAFT_79033 [Baudoinia panamericana UAMH 10762]EMC91665.1 hypothetical protein BAUCODRAFT_79033 [Baudoinia panamericana UAMH 10762]